MRDSVLTESRLTLRGRLRDWWPRGDMASRVVAMVSAFRTRAGCALRAAGGGGRVARVLPEEGDPACAKALLRF